MEELEAKLTTTEYTNELADLAREILVECVNNGHDYTDAHIVYDMIYGEFHEDYPVSIIEHADVHPGDPFPIQFGRDHGNPLGNIEVRSRAVLAKELTNYMDSELVAEGTELVNVHDGTGTLHLTDAGRELL